MSTKIYHGLRFNGDIFQLKANLDKFRDEEIFSGKRAWIDPEKYYSDEGYEMQKYKRERGIPERSSIILIPRDGFVLGFPCFSEVINVAFKMNDETLASYFAEETGMFAYGYWDNTDQPDDVTDEEWTQREKDWSCVGYKSIMYYGLEYLIAQDVDFVSMPK